MFAWGDGVSSAAASFITHVNSGSNNIYYQLAIRSTDKGSIVARDGIFRSADGITDILTGWHSLGGEYLSDTSKKLFVNGTEEADLTVSVAYAPSINNHSIGYLNRTGHADFFTGDIGFVAIWNVELTDAEETALGKGVNPFVIRNQSLVSYAQVNGNENPEPNWANRAAFASPTNFDFLGTPTKSTTNPPVQLLSRYMSGH